MDPNVEKWSDKFIVAVGEKGICRRVVEEYLQVKSSVLYRKLCYIKDRFKVIGTVIDDRIEKSLTNIYITV